MCVAPSSEVDCIAPLVALPYNAAQPLLDLNMSLQVGQQLGSYEITSSLDKGGMGEVYKAYDTRLDRTVADGCQWVTRRSVWRC